MVSSVDESPGRVIIHSGVGEASILSVLAPKGDRVGGFQLPSTQCHASPRVSA